MRMFLGEYKPNITEGSRIALPKKLRDQIRGEEVILSRGFEKCVFVYDKEDWATEATKQIENPITDARTRDIKRYMYSGAAEVTIDPQGRIVIPGNLKEYAGLGKNLAVVGAGDHVEIWDLNAWTARKTPNISMQLSETEDTR
ncbi:MAG: Protein MraZ [candidate division WWE3 bacterium GW2011_GWC1_42_102]|nr:MAG: Protein MraZ [candidate division WWE3 bacterium GW2011_GWC1_42_102]